MLLFKILLPCQLTNFKVIRKANAKMKIIFQGGG
jgi:hypothetical protein